jgi:hypothetical protein
VKFSLLQYCLKGRGRSLIDGLNPHPVTRLSQRINLLIEIYLHDKYQINFSRRLLWTKKKGMGIPASNTKSRKPRGWLRRKPVAIVQVVVVMRTVTQPGTVPHLCVWLEILPNRMNPQKLFIATPCYGGMLTDQYLHSILNLTQALVQRKIGYTVYTLRNESLITRARNTLVAVFLKSDCTDMMFIDADVQFEPDSILRMLEMDKPVIGAACPMKSLPLRYAVNFRFDGDPQEKKLIIDNGAIEVVDVGSSFLMIRREVFDKLIVAYPHLHYQNSLKFFSPDYDPYFYSFFDTMHDPETNRYLSEDYTFCRRWQQIGGKTWIDPKTKLTHVGSYTFNGNISDLLNWKPDDSCYLKSSTFNHTIASIFPQEKEPPVSKSENSGSNS